MIIGLNILLFFIIYNKTLRKNNGIVKEKYSEIKKIVKAKKVNMVFKKISNIFNLIMLGLFIVSFLLFVLYLGMLFFVIFGATFLLFDNIEKVLIVLGYILLYLIIPWIYTLILTMLIKQITLNNYLKSSYNEEKLTGTNSDQNSPKKVFGDALKKTLIAIVLMVICITLIILTNQKIETYNANNKNLKNVLDMPSIDTYSTNLYYFLYNEKIYYLLCNEETNYKTCLFVMNLDGTENKKISEDDKLKYANFYYVYNNEAYYYTFFKECSKINLQTLEITNLHKKYDETKSQYLNGREYLITDDVKDIYGNYQKIISVNSTHNYFYNDGNIYELNSETNNFELILSNVKKQPEYVYVFNNDLIFIEGTDEIKYVKNEHDFGSVVIYNKKSSKQKEFKNVRKVWIDDNYMYIVLDKGFDFHVEKYNLNIN